MNQDDDLLSQFHPNVVQLRTERDMLRDSELRFRKLYDDACEKLRSYREGTASAERERDELRAEANRFRRIAVESVVQYVHGSWECPWCNASLRADDDNDHAGCLVHKADCALVGQRPPTPQADQQRKPET